MNNENKYSIMTLKDMFWKIVSGWKLLIILIVVGAIAGNKFAKKSYDNSVVKYNEYVTDLSYDPAEEKEMMKASKDVQGEYASKRAEVWKSMLTKEQLSALKDISSVKGLIKNTEEFLDNSLLMQIDAYNINYAVKVYEVSSEVEGAAAQIIQKYTTFAANGALLEEISAKMGWKEEGISISSELLTAAAQNTVQLKVQLYLRNEEEAKKAASILDQIMEETKKKYNSQYGVHSIKIIDSVVGKKADLNIANLQNTVQSRQSTYLTQINNLLNPLKTNLTFMNYYNYVSSVENGGNGFVKAEADTKIEALDKPVLRTKLMTAAGAFAGIVAGIIIILCICLANGRLLKTGEMVSIFGLPYIGSLVREGSVFIIDRFINALAQKSDGPYKKGLRAELTASKISAICGEQGIKNIVVVGSFIKKAEKKSLATLEQKLKKDGINIEKAGNLITEVDVSDSALKNKKVFVAETVNKSSYKDIEKEIAVLKGCGVEILGALCIA